MAKYQFVEDNLWEYVLYFDRFEQCEKNFDSYVHLSAYNLSRMKANDKWGWPTYSDNRCYADAWNEYHYIRRNHFVFKVLKSWEDLVPSRFSLFSDLDFIEFANFGDEDCLNFDSKISEVEGINHYKRNIKVLFSLSPHACYQPAACGSPQYCTDIVPCACSSDLKISQSTFYEIRKALYSAGILIHYKTCYDITEEDINFGQLRCNIPCDGLCNLKARKLCRLNCFKGAREREKNCAKGNVKGKCDTPEFGGLLLEYCGGLSIGNRLCTLEDLNTMHMLMLLRMYSLNSHLSKMKWERDRLRGVVCTVFSALSKRAFPSHCMNSFSSGNPALLDGPFSSNSTLHQQDDQHLYLPAQQAVDLHDINGHFLISHDPKRKKQSLDLCIDGDICLAVAHPPRELVRVSFENVTNFNSSKDIHVKETENIESNDGTLVCTNNRYGEFCKSISLSAKLEVRFKEGWRVCSVVSRKFQEDNVRFIKVRPTRSYVSTSSWICLQENNIAPLGTNISSSPLNTRYQ